MSKSFWGVLAAIVVIFGLVFFFTHKNSTNNSGGGKPTQHLEGDLSSNIKLVEYGDYQCPYCGEVYPVLQQVLAKYSNQISFQFRNFPLTNLHPNAYAGARAAEAAGLMGKFWQMHNKLYQENVTYYTAQQTGTTFNTWINASNPLPDFDSYAKQLGLNVAQFNKYYNSNQVNNAIEADMAVGGKLNVQGTPTFFLNGKNIGNPVTLSGFEKIINAAIANNGKVSSSTTTKSTTHQTKK